MLKLEVLDRVPVYSSTKVQLKYTVFGVPLWSLRHQCQGWGGVVLVWKSQG